MIKILSTKKDLDHDGIALGAAIKLANYHRQGIVELRPYEFVLLNIVDYFLYNKYLSPRQLDTLKSITRRYFDKVLKGKRIRSVDFKEFKPLTYDIAKINKVKLNLKDFRGKLRPFQETGVKFIVGNKGRGIIADVMGLGKTVQAIAAAQHFYDARPVLIVCPALLKYNWANEIIKFVKNPTVYIVEGLPNGVQNPLDEKFLYHKGKPDNVYVIINYDIIANRTRNVKNKMTGSTKKEFIPKSGWVSFLEKMKPKMMIMDEAHRLKNYRAARTKATLQIARKCDHVIALTGTPIISAPIDMFYVMKVIAPNIVPNRTTFVKKFMKAKYNGFGWVYTGVNEENIDELKQLLSKIMIRRTKEEVLSELPPKTRTVLPVHLPHQIQKEYEVANANFIEWLKEKRNEPIKNLRAVALVKLGALRSLIAKGKVDIATEWIDDFLSTYPDKKIVVFAHHRDVIDALSKKLKYKNVVIWGGLSSKESENRVQQFKNDKDTRVLIGSIMAASVGLTLTVADTALFIELPWTSVDLDQAEDRIHRIGQDKRVNIYFLVAHETIEERIMRIIDAKREVINTVLTDNDNKNKDDFLTELLEQVLSGDDTCKETA